ncbi:fibronectin type 3 and ankyrin repeat domains protein 1-like [Mytilus californianus]|uniref:fibronectin type 3 and ankyrin repeat domains protein 1-like n=1 Tax=Mytilus californianus TaxID=6549 RepID=UPI002246FCDE|nr:fibronectin type 3 and ankyrin repeat domains protein 1-like [Mytilus californianus]
MLILQNGATPLMYAAVGGHLEIACYLASLGCNMNARTKTGKTALHIASQYGQLHVTKWLIEEGGISPLVKTSEGKTPYMLAAEDSDDSSEKKQEKKEIMDYLKTVMAKEEHEVTTGALHQIGLTYVFKESTAYL